jgi:hypothetical protein
MKTKGGFWWDCRDNPDKKLRRRRTLGAQKLGSTGAPLATQLNLVAHPNPYVCGERLARVIFGGNRVRAALQRPLPEPQF